MPRWNGIPSLRTHKASGQAFVRIDGRNIYLGKPGEGARQRYNALIGDWLRSGRVLREAEAAARIGVSKAAEVAAAADPANAPLSVAELCCRYLDFAETYYRDRDGTPNQRELGHYRIVVRFLRELAGLTPAADFGPLRLKALRERFIAQGWSRTYVNGSTQRVRRIWKWGAGEELVPVATLQALLAVEGLRYGRTAAPEGRRVKPVLIEHFEAVLPHVRPEVAAILKLLRLTGARPSEILTMRTMDVDTSGPLWRYRPAGHKTERHGVEREIVLGKQAQEVLRPWLMPTLGAPIFSPARGREARYAELRAARKSPVQPSQVSRKKRKAKRLPGDRYTAASLRRAVERACIVAGVPDWHPYQIRHLTATEVRRRFGIEAAQAVLGHKTLLTTQVYAEKNREAALSVAQEIG